MKYCEKCKVDVTDNVSRCPLCQRVLLGESSGKVDAFPYVSDASAIIKEHSILFKWCIFISIVASVVCVSLNFMIPVGVWWSLFVLGGIACSWISVIFLINKRKNIAKSMMYQVAIVSILCVLWDLFTGWRGWSLNYVLPILCVAAMIGMAILAKVMKLPIQDYIIYLIIGCVFGIIPVIFWLIGLITIIYPTVICITASIISLATLFVFEGDNLKAELKRRLHF